MSERLNLTVKLMIIAVLMSVVGLLAVPVSKLLIVIPAILFPVVVAAYYTSKDDIKKLTTEHKLLIFVVLQFYIASIMIVNVSIGVLFIVCLLVASYLRYRRLKKEKTV